MANKPRIIAVLPEIIKRLRAMDQDVFSRRQLSELFDQNKDRWRLPLYMDENVFMDQLAEQDFINEAGVDFPTVKGERLFYFDAASIYQIAAGMFPKGYLSHYSAMSQWGLTEQIPKTVYLTLEQSDSPSKRHDPADILGQADIDSAFSKPQRMSNQVASMGDYQIVLLRGKNTGDMGTTRSADGKGPRLTDVERTLIDIVVRPAYAGGPGEVLKAFRNANMLYKLSVNKLSGYLNRMDFIYPYHQAIGFYLEASGSFRESQVSLFADRPMEHDFYLAYDMKQVEYSKKWKIWYPKGMV